MVNFATLSNATGQAAAAEAEAKAKSSSTSNNRSTIANNFDQFLTLLTTQLKNQNPLEPLNTNEFTQQLVQFASVEQQLKSNETLTALLSSSQSQTTTNAASFIGKTITADGAGSELRDGKAKWTLNAPRPASDAVISIRDSKGNMVFQERRSLSQGATAYEWNGQTTTGSTAAAGTYSITVTARDTTGQDMTVATQVEGKVTGVDLEGGTPVLLVGTSRVSLDAVKGIRT